MNTSRPREHWRSFGVLLATVVMVAVSACAGSGDGDGSNSDDASMFDMRHGLLLEEFDEWEYTLDEGPDSDVPAIYDAIARLTPESEEDSMAFALSYTTDLVSADELEATIDSEIYAHTSLFQLDSWSEEDVFTGSTTISDYPAFDKRHLVEGEEEQRYSRLIVALTDTETVMLFGFAEAEYRDELNLLMDTLELEP